MTQLINVAVAGANGRMGSEIVTACVDNGYTELASAFVRSGNSLIGEKVTSTVEYSSQDNLSGENFDVLVDLTLPENTLSNLNQCVTLGKALVIGTTGFSVEQQQQINDAAKTIPILQASNMSIGVNLTLALLKKVATVAPSADIAISETHHIHKVDSPSGTAITMAEVIASSLNKNIEDCLTIDSIREGEVVGDHSVTFSMDNEEIEISHRATDRRVFSEGAIRAALWLAKKEPGLYSMDDMLDL
ncbi:MAG: 4-hydroxy-tetrahydrodipicolinate reductase [Gammaproteobacteria bacterium]|nr:4-hydroxy-tetrahydrodipicolinate reductase [Gammaproteobacteria bacterium]